MSCDTLANPFPPLVTFSVTFRIPYPALLELNGPNLVVNNENTHV